jgi:hypothetical protein
MPLSAKQKISKNPQAPTLESKRESALRKIAHLLEEQMDEMGLSEDEKDAKTAKLVERVSASVTASLTPRAKHSKHHQTS